MLRDDQKRPHRTTIQYIRGLIYAASAKAANESNGMALSRAKLDLTVLDDAMALHEAAIRDFARDNSDETMINLIGTWARLTKYIREMDDKYGSRE